MKVLSFIKRTAVLAAAAAVLFSGTAFANGDVKTRANGLAEEQRRFPFEIVLTGDSTERMCYTGYGEKYANGHAMTPDTEFEIVAANPDADVSALKIEIDMVSLNDAGKGSKIEKVRTFDYGDLNVGDGSTYAFLTERNRENLEERGKLYSDTQRSLCMTLTYKGADGKKTEKQYFQVCTDDDLNYYIENADAQAVPETEAPPEVYIRQ
ncbi:MAG: hypothetical protein Q4C63_06610 [Eubacteriales bacterium]|nr:hypothetical protein [Eubacteriales bacterium]